MIIKSFWIIVVTNILLSVFAIYFGDKDGEIELFKISERINALSFVMGIISFTIYSYQKRIKIQKIWLITVNFYLFIFFIFIAEIVFLYIESKNINKNVISPKEFRLTKPEPYQNSNYFSKEFINQHKNEKIIFF